MKRGFRPFGFCRQSRGVWACLAVAGALLGACADRWSVRGSSSQRILEGRTAYIRAVGELGSRVIDSCEVLHGEFVMSGPLDSVMLVRLSLGDDDLIPFVLEAGDIAISIGSSSVSIGGTPLNDRLYVFLNSRDSLSLLRAALPREESRMYLLGYSEDEILDYLGREELALVKAIDALETRFISENYDNALGVAWFLQLCAQAYRTFGYPTTTPQIDEIYFHAPEAFKQHPEVQRYMQAAN